MADEPTAGAPEPVNPNPEVAPAPEPTPEQFRAQVAERDAQIKLYKDTLAALGTRSEPQAAERAPSSAASPPPSDATIIRELAQETGYSEEQVAAYFPLVRSILRREAAPAMQTLLGVADETSQLKARLTVDDWKDIEQEAVKVAREYRSRGVFLDYTSAADIARARMGPQLLQQRAEREATQARARATQAAATGGEHSVEKAGPTTTKERGKQPKSADEIKRLPQSERQKALEDALGDTTF